MYGLLIEGVRSFVIATYNEEMWDEILRRSTIEKMSFDIHEVYSEGTLTSIVESCSKYLNLTQEDLMFANGKYFVSFLSQFGYDGVMRVLGRELRDFLNGLDNLHEYLRTSYPKLKPPSFFCVNESNNGITLQYRTRRKSVYISYVQGLITEIAQLFYHEKIAIDIICMEVTETLTNCIMRLHFDNKGFKIKEDALPVSSEIFFEVFPFNFVFNRGMNVIACGSGLKNSLPDVVGSNICHDFLLARPLIEFSWDAVMLHTNNVFELISIQHLEKKEEVLQNLVNRNDPNGRISSRSERRALNSVSSALRLRGQMKYIESWDAIIFMGTPLVRDVITMARAGLFVNDLSMHDSSRDMVLAGEQQAAELKLALQQEQEKSFRLDESMKRLDDEMKRTDELLYQMIPQAVAEKLRSGGNPMDTCECFEEASVQFSDVVGFRTIVANITPFEVINMLNSMYSLFDTITDKHSVYKVETVLDVYMIVSGCPLRTKHHAALLAETAMEMVSKISSIHDPSKPMANLFIRVGIHSGRVIGGIVGTKAPRYCLFGDTVNTASRMESTSEAQKINISQTTKVILEQYNVYEFQERGDIEVKGKGKMKTHFLTGRSDEVDNANVSKLKILLENEREKLQANLSSHQLDDHIPPHSQHSHTYNSASQESVSSSQVSMVSNESRSRRK